MSGIAATLRGSVSPCQSSPRKVSPPSTTIPSPVTKSESSFDAGATWDQAAKGLPEVHCILPV